MNILAEGQIQAFVAVPHHINSTLMDRHMAPPKFCDH